MDESEYSGPTAHQDLKGYPWDPGFGKMQKIIDGIREVIATREEGFAELLHGKENGIRSRDYKNS